jgi:hypothetical protein
MVSDLIRATAGDLQTCTDTTISASYKTTRQAIAAVRNLCLLVNGFSGPTAIHAAFTLCYPGDREHRDPAPTQPQRILLIGAICEAARTIPGLRFRELAPTAGCTTLELLAPPHHDMSSRPERSEAEKSQHSPLLTPAPNLSSRPKSAPFADAAERPVGLPAVEPNPKRRIQIFAAAGAIATIAIFAFVFIPRGSAKSQPAQPPTPIAAVVPPAPTPQPTPAPPIAATPKPPAETHKQPPPPPKTKQPPQPPPEHETAPPPSSSGVTFSPDEMKRMIASADKLSGDGNYDRAIALYDAVLRADRKNGAAAEGRQRAIYNRDHR